MFKLNTNTIIVIAAVLLFLVYAHNKSTNEKDEKSKEGYSNVFYNKNLDPKMVSAPSFNSNLNPNNPGNRSDPNVYGGFVNNSNANGKMLAAPFNLDVDAGVKKGMVVDPTDNSIGKRPSVSDGSYVPVSDSDYEGVGGETLVSGSSNSNTQYENVTDDFNSLINSGSAQDKAKLEAKKKYEASNNNFNPQTLKYTVPSDMLPAPDMRQNLSRDPSDPTNFMYDRTVFAPMKKRTRNEADRFRGDLEIEPIKTGWFDVAAVPKTDLVKGYFGYYTDIQEFQDLQDISYQRSRDAKSKKDTTSIDSVLSNIAGSISSNMLTPKMAYASPPVIDGTANNAWGNKRVFAE